MSVDLVCTSDQVYIDLHIIEQNRRSLLSSQEMNQFLLVSNAGYLNHKTILPLYGTIYFKSYALNQGQVKWVLFKTKKSSHLKYVHDTTNLYFFMNSSLLH